MRSLADCIKMHGKNLDSESIKELKAKAKSYQKDEGYGAQKADQLAATSYMDELIAEEDIIYDQLGLDKEAVYAESEEKITESGMKDSEKGDQSKRLQPTPDLNVNEDTGESSPAEIKQQKKGNVKLKKFTEERAKQNVTLEQAVTDGLITQKEKDVIDAVLDIFPQAMEDPDGTRKTLAEGHFEPRFSDQQYAPTDDQFEAHKTPKGKKDKSYVAGALVSEKVGQLKKDTKHLAVMFKGSDFGTFLHEFGEFIHARALSGKTNGEADSSLVKRMWKIAKTNMVDSEIDIFQKERKDGKITYFVGAKLPNRKTKKGTHIEGKIVALSRDYTTESAAKGDKKLNRKSYNRLSKQGKRTSKNANEWFADTFTHWFNQELAPARKESRFIPKELTRIFREVLRAARDTWRVLKGQGKPFSGLDPLFNSLVFNGREINENYNYSTKEASMRYVVHAIPGKDEISTQGFSGNAKTYVSYDPGTICPKQKAFVDWVIAKAFGRTQEEQRDMDDLDPSWDKIADPEFWANHYDKAKAAGEDVPCIYCYVEDARRLALNKQKAGKSKSGVNFAMATQTFESVPYVDYLSAKNKDGSYKLTDEKIKEWNDRGGLRMFSFSDYIRELHKDSITKMLADAKMRGLSVKAITKNPQFVEDFADRGFTINVSIDNESDGRMGGMPWKQAADLKIKHPNVKIRTVAVNTENYKYFARLGRDKDHLKVPGKFVDVITPYHGKPPVGATWGGQPWENLDHKAAKGKALAKWIEEDPEGLNTPERTCCQQGGKCYDIKHLAQCASNCGGFAKTLNVPKYQTGESVLPGQGVTLQDIQKRFPNQAVVISPDGSVSVRFKNGQGAVIKSVKRITDGDYQFAIDSGQMSKKGVILGKTEGNVITLDKDISDPETLSHEVKHMLDNLGIITKADNLVLQVELNKLRKKDQFNYPMSTHEDKSIAKQENLANVFAQVLAEREAYRGTRIGKILQKVQDFLDALIHVGQQSTRKLAKEVESGKIYGRESGGLKTSIPAYEKAAQKWYSSLVKAVEGVGQKTMPAKMWINMIDSNKFKQAGVKAEEVEWSGVKDWLEGKKKVTKQELLDYLAENQIEIEEIVKGEEKYDKTDEEEARWNFEEEFTPEDEHWGNWMEETIDGELETAWGDPSRPIWEHLQESRQDYLDFAEDSDGNVDEQEAFESFESDALIQGWLDILGAEEYNHLKEDAWDYYREDGIEHVRMNRSEDPYAENQTKFSDYQLPGGENYREILFRLPNKREPVPLLTDWMKDKGYPESEKHSRIAEYQKEHPPGDKVDYKVPQAHQYGDNESDVNRLMHMRVSDRTVDGKRVLHVEEIQSDWHQEARKVRNKEVKRIMKAEKLTQDEAAKKVPADFGYTKKAGGRYEVFNSKTGKHVSWHNNKDGAVRATNVRDEGGEFHLDFRRTDDPSAPGPDLVPNAPFKGTDKWTMLAMRRLVRMAAEGGYNSIAWTQGQEQADRYDLSKHIDAIHYHKETFENGLYQINLIKNDKSIQHLALKERDLEEHVGKEVASKMIDGKGKNSPATSQMIAGKKLSGLDLKVGGEGMKQFYDVMLKKNVNDFFNKGKWGKAKVGEIKIAGEDAEMAKTYEHLLEQELSLGATEDSPSVINAREKLSKLRGTKLHNLPITDKMRSKALREGMPLFQTTLNTASKAFKKWFGGSVVTNEDGKPLVVYHSTDESFTVFDKERQSGGQLGKGFYFTPDMKSANLFAKIRRKKSGKDTSTMAVYLSLQNPFVFEDYGDIPISGVNVELLKDMGHDGIIVKRNGNMTNGEMTVFNPTQIKSVHNKGSWSQTNPDIRYQTAEPVADQEAEGDTFSIADDSTLAEDFKYNVVDILSPVSKLYKAIKKKIPEYADFKLKEQLRVSNAKGEIDKSEAKYFNPIRRIIGMSGLNVEKVDEFLYARHAPEANARLRLTNARYYLNKLADAQKGGKLKKSIESLDAQFELQQFPTKEIQESYKLLLEKELDKAQTAKEIAVQKKWATFSAKPSGMTDAEAKKLSSKWVNNKPMKRIAALFDSMNNESLDISYLAGRMSQEEHAAVKGTFDYYAPLYREGNETKRAFKGIGGGITNLGTDVQTRGGSTKRAVNLLANAMVNHEKTIINAKKAEVAKAFLEFVKLNPNKDFWDFEETNTRAVYDTKGNIRRVMAQEIKDNEVKVKVDGETHIISVNPDNIHAMRILDVIQGNQHQPGPIVNALSKFNRILAAINTTWNPEFIISNFTRDIQTAAFNLNDTEVSKMKKTVFKNVFNAMKGLHSLSRGDGKHEWSKIAKRYEKSGAKIGWIDYGKDIGSKVKKLESQIDLFRDGHTTRKAVHSLVKTVEDYNSIVENAVRLSTFKAGIDSGMSESKAAIMAKGLTVNFNQKGAYGPVINSLYLFANAGIQGSTRIIKNLKNNPKKMTKVLGGVIGSAAALSIANSALGGDDDDGQPYYDQIDTYIKARNMIFMLPGTKGKYAKIPLPWGYNVFWAMGTEMGDALVKDDYQVLDGASRMVSTTLDAFNPLQSASILQTLSPTITDPVAMVGENKTFFGSPLMPEGNPFSRTPKPDSEKYWRSVSTPSRLIAKGANWASGGNKVKPGLIDVSPETLDLVFDTFTGGAGRFLMNTLETPVKIATGDFEFSKAPMLRKVLGSKSEYKVTTDYRENITHVYRLREQAKIYPENIKELKKDKTYYLYARAKTDESKIRKLNKFLKKAKSEKTQENIRKKIEKLKKSFNRMFTEKSGE